MSRQSKFRVWCKDYNEWEKDICLLSQDGLVYQLFKWGLQCIRPEQHIVQFSTGVKDVNEKEIYEGDIVWLDFAHSFEPWEKESNRFEIVFKRGCFQLKPIKLSKPQGNGIGGGNSQFHHIVEIIGHDKDDFPIYKYHLPPPRPLCDFGICSVMGNIFENPELLEK